MKGCEDLKIDKNRLFITAFIADIHFGALKSEDLFAQLQKRFLGVIAKNHIDMIVFGGDIFHSIITMNYSTSHYVLMFMERVLDICVKNKVKFVRVIQGTMSHDNNQLNNFKIYENRTDVDFKIFRTVGEETLPGANMKILYVPEEYMTNPEEYYSSYLSKYKEYDMIFGHGMFQEVSYTAKKQESEITMSKAPVFNSKIFINTCKGPIYFGHIHTRTDIKEHIHYPGSFSRFRHGEEDDKGWYLSIYDKVTGKYIHQFIKNTLAEKYTTITAIVENDMDPTTITAAVQDLLNKDEHVMIKLIIKDNVECSYFLAYMNNIFQSNKDVKIKVQNEFEFRQELMVDEKVNEIMDKYSFIKDPGFTHEEKIQKFIKIKKGRDVPIEVITDIINKK